jgi:hypothetical protein
MNSAAPIFITGMHRSGTSLVANLLRQCGLWLGPEDELLGAHTSNPDGHWEKIAIVELNDVLLSELGGGWDSVPDFPADWPGTVAKQRERASEIHSSLARPTPWGWKDPRASVLMPFWLAVEPEASVVICLRHPLEVVQSLRQRGPMSYSLGLKLWRVYNQRLLADVPRPQRTVVHYADFFTHPDQALRRLANLCDLTPSDEEVSGVLATVKPELRHAEFNAGDLVTTQVATETIRLYQQLCEEAGFRDDSLRVEEINGSSRREADLDALSYFVYMRNWRRLVEQHTPEGAVLAVVSKGDGELVQLHNRKVQHFPQTAAGSYAGHHPEDSAEAIAQLEAVRAKGTDYLLVPAPSLWWLNYYVDFTKHLELNFAEVAASNGLGRLFHLKHPVTDPPQK